MNDKKDYTGRWVKILTNFAGILYLIKGSYDKITKYDQTSDCMTLDGYGSCVKERLTNGDLELMPEGWSPDTEDIPEYVECIKLSYKNYGELGKVYKVKNWNHSISDCMLEGTTSGSTARRRFKSSTKEKYDAQVKSSIPTHVKCVSALSNAEVGVIYPVIDAEHCKCENDDIYIWTERQFVPSNIEEYEQQFMSSSTPKTEYFSDLSKHIGRYIKALVNSPLGGTVKKGEIGQIMTSTYIDFPSYRGYAASQALSEKSKDKFELMPIDYVPYTTTQYNRGKWYTCHKWGEGYLKLAYVNDQQAYFTEAIEEDIHVYKKDWWPIVGYPLIEADMNIVSKLLPDGHPDKINTSSQVKEWSEGTYVVITGEYHSVKIGEVHEIQDEAGGYIDISRSVGKGCLPYKGACKWFATRDEAIAFSILNYPTLTSIVTKGIEDLISQETDAIYACVGDPLPKTKPLIEDVQSVSVNLRTKKQINKFKI